MQKEFSRRDFLKGMAVVTASGLLVACGGGNGTPVKLAFVAMDNFYDQAETQKPATDRAGSCIWASTQMFKLRRRFCLFSLSKSSTLCILKQAIFCILYSF